MIEYINFENSINEFQSINITPKDIKPVYILCQNSLINKENINIKKFINKQLNNEELKLINQNNLKMNFNSYEIMELKNNKKEIFILDKISLLNIGLNENKINQTNIYYFKDNFSQKFLIFINEFKILKIESQNKTNIISENKNIDIRINILKCLILLYANEKEINKLFNSKIEDEYDFKKYYLVNRKWIDSFKDIFKYKEIYKILSQYNNINYYKDYERNLNNLTENNTLQNVVSNITELPNFLKNDINLFLSVNQNENNNEVLFEKFPHNFELIPKSLFKLLIQMTNHIKENYSESKYKMLIGNKNLYLQDNNNTNIFYIYCYNSSSNSYTIFAIINYFIKHNFYSEIQYLKDEDFIRYAIRKNYNLNKINVQQDILDSNKNILGSLILKYHISKNYIKNEKNKIKIDENYLIFKNFKQFYGRLSSLKEQNFNLTNNNIIDIYLSQNKLIYLNVYIVESDKLDYIKKYINFDYFEQKDKNKDKKNEDNIWNNLLDISNPFNDNHNFNIEIISQNKINQNIKYFLIDEKFCKDLKIPFEKYKPYEVLLFRNQNNFLLYFKNSKDILKLINITKTSFNICKYNLPNNNKILVLDNLLKLYHQEKRINNLLKGDSISKPINCYLINKFWLNEYKKFYNYALISQKIRENGDNINNNDLMQLFENKKLNDNLTNENYIFPKKNNIFYNNEKTFSYYTNFEIIEKNIFDLILKEINSNNNYLGKKLKSSQIIFHKNKIYIKCIKDYFIIGSLNYKNQYEENYMMIINDNKLLNQFITNLFNSFIDNEEKFFTQLGLYINQIQKVQNIKYNNNLIGFFISISPILKEPNHCLGLQNIGATCYMNATLQCLCHISSLKNYFKDYEQLKKDINNKNTPLTKSFYEVIHNLWKESNITYYAPTNFKNLISKLNPLFMGIQANDSKDLIIFIYETLHNELNNPNFDYINSLDNLNIPQELKIFRQNYFSNNNSIITKIFYSEQSSNIKCCNCNINKISFNIISFLIFPLEKVRLFLEKKKYGNFQYVSLEDCFEQNEENENLNGQNQIYCNNCGRNADAISYNKLYTCPEILTIILNRGKGLEFDVEFQFPMYLNIDKYVTDKSNNTNYELIGVITHLGESGMSGHFIAYCKSPVDKNWYIYNDAIVQRCVNPENEIKSCGIPYVLYYQKYKSSKLQESSKKNTNEFKLEFMYNDYSGFVEINKNISMKEVIQLLYKKCSWVPKQGVGFYVMKNDNMIEIQYNKTFSENNLTIGDKIIIA